MNSWQKNTSCCEVLPEVYRESSSLFPDRPKFIWEENCHNWEPIGWALFIKQAGKVGKRSTFRFLKKIWEKCKISSAIEFCIWPCIIWHCICCNQSICNTIQYTYIFNNKYHPSKINFSLIIRHPWSILISYPALTICWTGHWTILFLSASTV